MSATRGSGQTWTERWRGDPEWQTYKDYDLGWRYRLLAEVRRQRLTYEELASRMGVSLGQVGKHLQGKAKFYHDFCERAARVLEVSPRWILEGVHEGDWSAPVLNKRLLSDFLLGCVGINGKEALPEVDEFVTCPALLGPGRRCFVWQLVSDDLDDGESGWLESDWLFADPDRPALPEETPVVIALLKRGIVVRRLREIAGDLWLVPENRVYQSIPVEDEVQTMAVVIGGLRVSSKRYRR